MSDDRRPWENDYWTPEPLFRGETVFVVASGPSLTPEVADSLRGHRVITVNGSAYLTPWADVLFFTDSGWFETGRAEPMRGKPGDDEWPRRRFVEEWPGLVVSMSRTAKRVLDDPRYGRSKPRILRVKGVGDPSTPPRWNGVIRFPPIGHNEIRQGRNSGNSAASLAIAMGAARVPLVGFDCRVVDGREHCHDEYAGQPRDLALYDGEFKRAFNGWREAAGVSGAEIVNATPGSAITEFPMVDLGEELARGAA
jgi:hypothetical protein